MIQKVDRGTIKAQAKQQLQGKIWMTFLCILVAGLIGGAVGQIPARMMRYTDSALVAVAGWVIYIAALIFIVLPIGVGMNKVYLNITYGYKPSVATLFEPFSKYYKNSILTSLYVGLIEALWYLPFFIGSVILSIIAVAGAIVAVGDSFIELFADIFFGYATDIDLSLVSSLIQAVAIIYVIVLLLMIPYVIIINAYAQTMFVLCEYPNTPPTQCVEASKAMMKGRRWELFVLNLSFILWYLLVVVTFGIAIIYVGPYVSVTLTNYYHRIKGGYVGNDAYNGGGYGTGYNAGYGAYQPDTTQYSQPAGSQYGSNVPYSQPTVNTATQPKYDPNTGEPLFNTDAPVISASADETAYVSEETARESEQALEQASHDMMTNFDDYTTPDDNSDKDV